MLKDDDIIVKKHETIFRFAVGQDVLFDPRKAIPVSPGRATWESISSWLPGRVTAVDIIGERLYFPYKCSFVQEGNVQACFIFRDTDEFIANKHASPRERLFEAITQDCSPKHLTHLVKSYNIDVSMFVGMAVDAAMKEASYCVSSFSYVSSHFPSSVLC